jgi:hypothetical protein
MTDLAVTPFGGAELLRKAARALALSGRRERLDAGVQRKLRNRQPMYRADMTKSERASIKHFGSNQWNALQMPINGGPERARRTSWSRGCRRALTANRRAVIYRHIRVVGRPAAPWLSSNASSRPYFYTSAPRGVNARICRGHGRTPRGGTTRLGRALWSVGSHERREGPGTEARREPVTESNQGLRASRASSRRYSRRRDREPECVNVSRTGFSARLLRVAAAG